MPVLDLEVQLVKIVDGADSTHGTTSPGSRLVAGQFAIRHRAGVVFEPYKAGTLWKASDRAGVDYEPTAKRVDPSLHALRLRPGASATGFITFELPGDAILETVTFSPSSDADLGIWLGLDQLEAIERVVADPDDPEVLGVGVDEPSKVGELT